MFVETMIYFVFVQLHCG